jgi:hypothetical protein
VGTLLTLPLLSAPRPRRPGRSASARRPSRPAVVELKVGKFQPEFASKLGFYVSVVDDVIAKPQHNPTVGLLLCADRNKRVVRYSLGNTAQPMAVSTYTYDTLPPAEQWAPPAADEVAAALDTPV